MAIKTSWVAGDVLAAADLTDTFAAKSDSASPTFTGTVDMTGATVLGVGGGLVYITSGTGASAASIIVNNCFTSDYANYRIVLTLAASNDTTLNMRLRAAGTDNSTASSYLMQRINANTTTVGGLQDIANQWQGPLLYTAGINPASMDVYGPQLASWTTITAHGFYSAGSAQLFSGRHDQATAYDGFTIYPAAGTISGTVRIYGYQNA
jgi:hypothetical protein